MPTLNLEAEAVTFSPSKYGRLLAKFKPSVIHSDAENERLAELFFITLGDGKELSPEERALKDLLHRLLVDYDERCRAANPEPRPSPAEMLASVMEFGGLRQVDLVDVFGTQSRVSDALHGKRRITRAQAERLQKRFNVPTECFLESR